MIPLGDDRGWTNSLWRYNQTPELWHCPSSNSIVSYTLNGGACSYPVGTGIWPEGSASDIKNPSAFILFVDAIGSGNQSYDRTRRPFSPTSKATQAAGTGDADQTDDSQPDGSVYHDSGGNYVAKLSQSAPMSQLEQEVAAGGEMTGSWELHFPGRHSGGNNISFIDGHVRFFKDWAWGTMTFRRAGPFPQGDGRNSQGL